MRPGTLFYVDNKVLWAHPFDETTRQLSGNRRRLMGGLPESTAFSVSNTGVLAYWTQPLIQQAAQLQWMDRRGNRLDLVNTPVVYDGFNLSRSGTRLATAQVGSDGSSYGCTISRAAAGSRSRQIQWAQCQSGHPMKSSSCICVQVSCASSTPSEALAKPSD